MNEPTTKEEALVILDQLQSKFNITKKDINESFNDSLFNSGNKSLIKIKIASTKDMDDLVDIYFPESDSYFDGNNSYYHIGKDLFQNNKLSENTIKVYSNITAAVSSYSSNRSTLYKGTSVSMAKNNTEILGVAQYVWGEHNTFVYLDAGFRPIFLFN